MPPRGGRGIRKPLEGVGRICRGMTETRNPESKMFRIAARIVTNLVTVLETESSYRFDRNANGRNSVGPLKSPFREHLLIVLA